MTEPSVVKKIFVHLHNSAQCVFILHGHDEEQGERNKKFKIAPHLSSLKLRKAITIHVTTVSSKGSAILWVVRSGQCSMCQITKLINVKKCSSSTSKLII